MASPRMQPAAISAPAIYARVSTADQDCALQLAALREWCERMHMPRPVEYVDHGWSGAKKSRPALDRLMNAALAGQHDWIAVWKLDRFGRSLLHLKQSLEKLEQARIRFAAITQNIDTGDHNSMGKFLLNMLGTLAEFERDTLIERVNAGRMVKFAAGQPDSWNLVYGFEKGRPIENKAEADLMRNLFRWRDEEYSLYELEEMVTEYAAERGLKPPRGDKWHARTLMNWLANRQYCGEYHRGGEVFELPRIIEQDVFDRVQAKHAATRQKHQGNPRHKGLWTGILRSEHDAPMHTVRHQHYDYYRCNGSVCRSKVHDFQRCGCDHLRAEALEPCWAAIWALLNNPAMQRSQAQAFAREEEAKQPRRGKDAREKLETAKDEVARVKRLAVKGLLDEDEAVAKVRELREQIQGYEAEARAMGRVMEIAPASLYEQACRARAKMREPKGAEDRREVLDGIRDLKVRLQGNEAVITGSIPVGAEQAAAGGNGENCENRFSSLHSSPFRLRVKLAA